MVELILVWVVAILFFVIGVMHLSNSAPIKAAYKAWGYPNGFNFVTGVIELAIAGLIVAPTTRDVGLALGGLVCLIAMGTLLRAKQYSHLVAPIVLIALVAVLWFVVHQR